MTINKNVKLYYLSCLKKTTNTMRLLFLFLPFLCFSQHSIFQDSLQIIKLNDDKLLVNGIENTNLELITLKEKNYFIDRLGGNVFVLKDLELNQIDNSYRHRMQIGSNIFKYNDTIFRNGGYGFWETRRLLTFYDFTTNEWEVVKSSNNGVEKFNHLNTIKNSKSIFFGGYSKQESLSSIENKSTSVYLFDFKKKEWSNLGNSKYHFSSNDGIIDMGDDKKLIIRKNLNDTIFLIKPFENKIEFYRSNSFTNSVVTEINLKSYYKDSTFFFINKIFSKNKLEINKRLYDEVLSIKLGESSFINKRNNHFIEVFSIFFLVICFIIYFKKIKTKRKQKTLMLIKDTLIHKKRKIKISDYEISIINLLDKNHQFKIGDLMDILEKKELNYNHQLRIINDTIKDLNNKITTLMDLEKPLIELTKSDLDKRIKIYRLNNNVKINVSDK